MKTFSEKVKQARAALGLNQQQLGDLAGVSKRSVAAYESTGIRPRSGVMQRLAAALHVSVDYLLNDGIDDPRHGIEKAPFLQEARDKYGKGAAEEMDALLERNAALFAGGTLEQDAKDAFFEAVMKAYLTCKEEARKSYGRKQP